MRTPVKNIMILILGLMILSCNNESVKKENQRSISKPKITVYDYQIWLSNLNKKELRDSIIVYIDTFTFNGRKNYIYQDSLIFDSSYRYMFSIERDSFFYQNKYCKTLDTISLDNEKERIELFISDFDIESSVDEECYIYWSKRYGLIAVYNYPWGALTLFENDRLIGFAKDKVYNDLINKEKDIRKKLYK